MAMAASQHGPRVRTLKSDPLVSDRRSALKAVIVARRKKESRRSPPLLAISRAQPAPTPPCESNFPHP